MRRRARAAVPLLAVVLAACSAGGSRATPAGATGPGATSTLRPSPSPNVTDTRSGPGYLAPGSDPSVLPGPILIADEGNNRAVVIDPTGHVIWQFPRPGDLPAGETFQVPDDTFYSAESGSRGSLTPRLPQNRA